MSIELQLFARARDLAGRERVELELSDGATVAELRVALAAAVPALAPLVPHLHVAVDREYATDAVSIPAGAEVACFPPVSGG
jgi:sulfur-carrier protein